MGWQHNTWHAAGWPLGFELLDAVGAPGMRRVIKLMIETQPCEAGWLMTAQVCLWEMAFCGVLSGGNGSRRCFTEDSEINFLVPTWKDLVKSCCFLKWQMFPAILCCFSPEMKTHGADAQVSQHHFVPMLFSRNAGIWWVKEGFWTLWGWSFSYLLVPGPKHGSGVLVEDGFRCRVAICHRFENLGRQEFGEIIRIWHSFLLLDSSSVYPIMFTRDFQYSKKL